MYEWNTPFFRRIIPDELSRTGSNVIWLDASSVLLVSRVNYFHGGNTNRVQSVDEHFIRNVNVFHQIRITTALQSEFLRFIFSICSQKSFCQPQRERFTRHIHLNHAKHSFETVQTNEVSIWRGIVLKKLVWSEADLAEAFKASCSLSQHKNEIKW